MYLLDANVLIEAKNRYYAFDIAPGFWDWLDYAFQQSLACSIEPVRKELEKGNDDLAKWASTKTTYFLPIDQGTTNHFNKLSRWAHSRNFTRSALAKFTSDHTDFLLVAYAAEHKYTVTTLERSDPKQRSRVKSLMHARL